MKVIKKYVIIILTTSMLACTGENNAGLNLKEDNISHMTCNCDNQVIALNKEDVHELTGKLNAATFVGPVKGVVKQNLTIYSKNGDTLKLRILDDLFFLGTGDFAYRWGKEDSFFKDLCAHVEGDSHLETKKLDIKNPIATIQRIVDNYNEFQESTDSPENLDSLKQSLKLLETSSVSKTDLTLVLNFWMYYTVTDFDAMTYAERVLFAHREQSMEAIKARMRNKEKWETEGGAPFSDLNGLLERLGE